MIFIVQHHEADKTLSPFKFFLQVCFQFFINLFLIGMVILSTKLVSSIFFIVVCL